MLSIHGLRVSTYEDGEVGKMGAETTRLEMAHDKAKEDNVPFDENVEYHRAMRIQGLNSDLRALVKKKPELEESVRPLLLGSSRFGLRLKPREGAPHPISVAGLPEDVRKVVDQHIWEAAFATAKPANPNIGNPNQVANQKASEQYLEQTGVDPKYAAKILMERLAKAGHSATSIGQWQNRLLIRLNNR
jgi:hypothetical protein